MNMSAAAGKANPPDRDEAASPRGGTQCPEASDFRLEATLDFPELDQWRPLLDRLEVPHQSRIDIAARARINGVTFLQEFSVSGTVSEAVLHRALAKELGVEFLERIDPDKLIVRDRDCIALLGRPIGAAQAGLVDRQSMSVVMDTRRLDIERARDWLERAPELAHRLKITLPSVLRGALFNRARQMLAEQATDNLAHSLPDRSAQVVVDGRQGFVLGGLAVALAVAVAMAPMETLFGVHVFFTLFFFACAALRFAAVAAAKPATPFSPRSLPADEMPIYSILVALHKEVEVVPQLLAALDAIVWPRSKLEIKLVCEADDQATLAAIRACPRSPIVEIIEVPVSGPRTKPKALNYALPATSGEYLVLYDAEDRPHPLQLVEAWQRFHDGDPQLACVQAPLEITNWKESAVARMFAFEYAALFRGLLPWLSARRLLMPLGGTSNHFRRSALDEIGGWDPYNVTEDADLGLRLACFGYHAETISSPTHEDAPEDLRTWLPQRTRWFKGWLQTWLVHMRHPQRIAGELGYRSLAIFHILFAGILISALAQPVLILSGILLAVDLALDRTLGTTRSVLLLVDVVNICCGYLSFLLLGRQAVHRHERQGLWKTVLLTPVYWLLMSAAWRSVLQIVRRPHHWEKTTHQRSRSAAGP
jgi:cellulose synthase/poly-beta-1,6-N-acetylglucosamine synthase-like glycosyltransferase